MSVLVARLPLPVATSTAVRSFGAALIAAIIVVMAVSTFALRQKDERDWRSRLNGLSFMLAEHTSQTVFSAYLVLDSITERVRQSGVQTQQEFREQLATPELHRLLAERIQGLRQIDVASLVAANGDNINYSRAWPVPPINLAERDYFRAHQSNPALGDYISAAVRNKGNGKWTFYISRRLDDAQGNFMGLVLVGLSVDAVTEVYERVVSTLGEGSAITLFRDDLTSLARAPRKDDVIGKINENGSAHLVIDARKESEGVVLIDTPRYSTGERELRLSAVRRTERYPLVVSLVVPESIFLASWRRTAALIAGSGLLSIGFVLVGIALVNRSAAQRERNAAELRDSETKFHTMVAWATDWEYWIRPDGSIHYMTPSAEVFTGYPVSDFERDPSLIDALIHPADRALWHQREAEETAALVRSGQGPGCDRLEPAPPLDLRVLHRSGQQRWVSLVSRPVYGSRGEYQGRRVSMRDVTDRKASEDEIRQLAYFDGLTHLPNRRWFMDALSQALIRTELSQQYGALLMLDLDQFKKLNDTQGHDVGDLLLIEVARRLSQTLGATDAVARLGGDEFGVMIDALGSHEALATQQAEAMAAKIHAVLNAPYLLVGTEADHRSSPSMGMTLFRGNALSIEVLMKQADLALYQAKDGGRNTVRVFNPAMQAALDKRMTMELALRQAIAAKQFQLYYQPQVDEIGQRIGAEALLRWMDASGNLVSPAEFIPLAEETGLILDLGQWVIDTACAQLRQWEDDPKTRELHISVNVSARQFHQPDFVQSVCQSLATSGANPHRLMLELTESIVVDHVEEVIQRMGELRRLGVTFSLDDFGTGYSSLSYLKQLPLDEVKIDRSFVRDVVDDQNDAAIVRAILAMSETLGLRVIAEGVETAAQRDFLLRNGCSAYQGYFFGRPAPIESWAKEIPPA